MTGTAQGCGGPGNMNAIEITRKMETDAIKFYTEDADECMDGVKCIHLGVQLDEFMKNFDQ
jgi:hypothetical protein